MMTNVIVADRQATEKLTSLFEQSRPPVEFEFIGTVVDRVVSELMARLQKNVA